MREHWVVRGCEESAVLIAARKDHCSYLDFFLHDSHIDHRYRDRGTQRNVVARALICKVGFKQNVDHLGTDIVVA